MVASIEIKQYAFFRKKVTYFLRKNITDLNDQELTDSVMLEMEPRPSPTLQLTSAALSDDDDAETAEDGRRLVSALRQSELHRWDV